MSIQEPYPRFPFSTPSPLDISPEYARRHRDERVARVVTPTGAVMWLVAGHGEARTVLGDPRFSRAAAARPEAPRPAPTRPEPGALLSMDRPEHTRVRRVMAPAFTAQEVDGLRPWIAATTDRLLAEVAAEGPPADLVDGFTRRLPVAVVCRLLGAPYADRDRFQPWSDVIFGVTVGTDEEIARSKAHVFAYVADLIAAKRDRPDESLLSRLVCARDKEGRLSEEELLNFGFTLVVPGHQTTSLHLANAILILLRHPEEMSRLREHPELLPEAVEELLRYSTHVDGSVVRVATEDVELGGARIRAGDGVLVSIVAANRDEAVFCEADRFDMTRNSNPQISFGYGTHYCLGAHLARTEIEVGLSALVRRFPRLRLAVPAEEIPWRRGWIKHTLRSLPVVW